MRGEMQETRLGEWKEGRKETQETDGGENEREVEDAGGGDEEGKKKKTEFLG